MTIGNDRVFGNVAVAGSAVMGLSTTSDIAGIAASGGVGVRVIDHVRVGLEAIVPLLPRVASLQTIAGPGARFSARRFWAGVALYGAFRRSPSYFVNPLLVPWVSIGRKW